MTGPTCVYCRRSVKKAEKRKYPVHVLLFSLTTDRSIVYKKWIRRCTRHLIYLGERAIVRLRE